MNKKIVGLILFGLFFLKSWIGIDTDFGWHIRLAEYIHLYGLPYNDPLSYTLASVRYIDMEWLYHLILWPVYSVLGRFSLAVFYSIIALVPLVYLWKKYQWDGLISILLLFSVFILRMGIRPEVYTWLLFFGLFVVLQSSLLWKKYTIFLPLLLILWVNIHGSFVLPLLLMAVMVIAEFITKREGRWRGLLVVVLSLIATLINPYGFLLWQETMTHLVQPLLSSSVMEWGRAYTYPEFSHIFLMVSLGFFLYRYRLRFRFEEIVISLLLLVLSILSIRLVPVFSLWGALLLPKGIRMMREDFSKIPMAGERIIVSFKVLLVVVGVFGVIETASSIRTAYSLQEERYYPQKALTRLQDISITGNIFSIYEWGGYLDWKYPNKKVFIDGRVSSFRSVYSDYLDIMKGHRVGELFSKYSIQAVLLKKGHGNDSGLRNYLALHGWKSVYRDDVAEILILGQ